MLVQPFRTIGFYEDMAIANELCRQIIGFIRSPWLCSQSHQSSHSRVYLIISSMNFIQYRGTIQKNSSREEKYRAFAV